MDQLSFHNLLDPNNDEQANVHETIVLWTQVSFNYTAPIHCSHNQFPVNLQLHLIRVNPCVTQFQYLPVFMASIFMDQYWTNPQLLQNYWIIRKGAQISSYLISIALITAGFKQQIDLYMLPTINTTLTPRCVSLSFGLIQ